MRSRIRAVTERKASRSSRNRNVELKGHAKEVAEELGKLDRATQLSVIESVLGDHSVCRTMLRATGRAEEPPPEIVLMGDAPSGKVLKKVQQPLVDTIILDPGWPEMSLSAFVDNLKFPDGTPKTAADTNMSYSAQLGYPLEYDLRWIELHFAEYESPEIARLLLSRMNVAFFFGCNTPWLRLSASAWKPLVACPKHSPPVKYASDEKFAKAVADEIGKRGGFWPSYWAPIGNPDGFRRIVSTESFRIEAQFTERIPLRKRTRIQFAMQDTLYTIL
jgi:hypothetical protein